MEVITINFKAGELIPGPGDVFLTRKPDAPGGAIKVQVSAILQVGWYKSPKAKKPEGVAVVMAAVVTVPDQQTPDQEGGAGQ